MRLYLDAADRFTATVDATTDWSAASPCEGWSAADVVDHVVDTERQFLQGHGADLGERPSGAPAEVWRQHLDAVRPLAADEGFRAREYDGFFGRTTIGETLDHFYGFDLVVHGWDLARATGQDETIERLYVERVWTMAKGFDENLRRPGVCGPEVPVPADAPLQDRLLGLLGRDPAA